MKCPLCKVFDCIRYGRLYGRQRYKCNVCGYQYTHDFPFDQATAEDAVHWYLYSCYGDLCTTMFTR